MYTHTDIHTHTQRERERERETERQRDRQTESTHTQTEQLSSSCVSHCAAVNITVQWSEWTAVSVTNPTS